MNDRIRGGGQLTALDLLTLEVQLDKRTLGNPYFYPLHSRELQPI